MSVVDPVDEIASLLRRAAEIWLDLFGWESWDPRRQPPGDPIELAILAEVAFCSLHSERFPRIHAEARWGRLGYLVGAEPPRDGELVVYRHLDEEGAVLYIGRTERFAERQARHLRESRWGPRIASIEVETFPGFESMAEAEVRQIGEFLPPFNRQHRVVAC